MAITISVRRAASRLTNTPHPKAAFGAVHTPAAAAKFRFAGLPPRFSTVMESVDLPSRRGRGDSIALVQRRYFLACWIASDASVAWLNDALDRSGRAPWIRLPGHRQLSFPVLHVTVVRYAVSRHEVDLARTSVLRRTALRLRRLMRQRRAWVIHAFIASRRWQLLAMAQRDAPGAGMLLSILHSLAQRYASPNVARELCDGREQPSALRALVLALDVVLAALLRCGGTASSL